VAVLTNHVYIVYVCAVVFSALKDTSFSHQRT